MHFVFRPLKLYGIGKYDVKFRDKKILLGVVTNCSVYLLWKSVWGSIIK